jgi:hypothetical protein
MSQDSLTDLLQLSSAIAIAFTDTPPAGITRVANPGPAGCAYWKQVADGDTFYTTADDTKPARLVRTHTMSLRPPTSSSS